jgi:hypothetical protein
VREDTYVATTIYPDGTIDLEILDAEPTEDYIEGVIDNVPAGTRLVIRVGHVNGGDSATLIDAVVPNDEEAVADHDLAIADEEDLLVTFRRDDLRDLIEIAHVQCDDVDEEEAEAYGHTLDRMADLASVARRILSATNHA